MSITKRNITIPDTLRTFERNSDKYKLTESLFITPDDFTFTTAQFEDDDYWYSQLGINIFPLHGITSFASEDTKNTYQESIQDFSYKTNNGKYKQRVRYDWSLDYHQLINELSGQNLKVIYVSGRVLRATQPSTGVISGFTMSLFDLEKILFTTPDTVGNSELFLEWADSNELNETGYEVEVDWNPGKMDRLVLNIQLVVGDESLTMGVKYLSENITGISSGDITITDALNGNITFTTFVPGDGIYILSGFSDTLTHACLYIQSTLYIGYKKFTFIAVVTVDVGFDLMSGDGFDLMSGDGFDLITKDSVYL